MKKSNRIREIRKSRDITLDTLAEKTGISTSFLSRIEGGQRGLSLENAVLIARALGVEVHEVDERFLSILPPSKDHPSSLDDELISVLPNLSEDSRRSLLDMARRLRELEGK